MNEYNKQKETHRYTEQTGSYQWGEGRGLRDKNYYVKKLSNKDILYSTRKYSHYFVITLNGYNL